MPTEVERSGGLQAFRRFDEHVLIVLVGTEYFCFCKIACWQCSTRPRSNGRVGSFHSMLSAAPVPPGNNHVVVLQAEFMVTQDGSDKLEGESRGARCWFAAHGPQYARLKPIYLGDDLFATPPICAAIRAVESHFLLTCKPAFHPLIG